MFLNSIKMEFCNVIFHVTQDENDAQQILKISQENNIPAKSISSIAIPQEYLPIMIDMIFSASRYMERNKQTSQCDRGSAVGQKQKKPYTLADKQKLHNNAYEKWDSVQEEKLKRMFYEKKTVQEMCLVLKRTTGAIQSRLMKLGLVKFNSD